MTVRRINVSSGRPLEHRAHYSRALRIGDVVLQSGTTAIDREGRIIGEGDVAAQVDAIMALAAESMGAAEGRFEDVVRGRLYVVGSSLLEPAGRAFARHFAGVRPALTAIPISRLARPTQLIEIELEAVDGASDAAVRLDAGESEVGRWGASRAVRIGDRVLLSGVLVPEQRPEAAPLEALEALVAPLESLGARRADLVYTKAFLADLGALGTWCAAAEKALRGSRPVGSFIGLPAEARGPWAVIDGEAIVGASTNRLDSGSAPVGPFSRAVTVGDRIYLAALPPVDEAGQLRAEGDWAGQLDACTEELRRALESVGAGLDDVITRRIFTVRHAEMNRPYGEGPPWFEGTRPVALGCRIESHPEAGALVALEALAVRGAAEAIEWREISEGA